MPLLDWLRGTTHPTKRQRADPLQEALRRNHEQRIAALEAINVSRRRRGVPPLAWEDLIAEPSPHQSERSPEVS